MKRFTMLAVWMSLCGAALASAQDAGPWQFRWQKGQVLTYQVEHKTSVTEVVGSNRVESASKLNLVKRWQVADVDAKGTATLNLSLASLRQEQTRTGREPLLFDSANPEKSTPELKEQMSPYVGKTLASIRVDTLGRVVEVLQGAANRYESEPPFVLMLPGQTVQQGQAWQRTFNVTLDPPAGTGEKYAASQTYQWSSTSAGKAVVALTTQFKSLPEAPAERVPLLQKQPEGRIVFDVQTGRLLSAQLVIDKTINNLEGEGSSYRYQSQYVEQLVPGN